MVLKNETKKTTFTYAAENEVFKVPLTVRIARLLFKLISLISTRISIKFATYLFLRPRKTTFNKFDLEAISKATKYDLSIGNKVVKVYSWGSSPKKVLFVHGWEGKGTSCKRLIEPLIKNNYQVIAFDAPAHGRSTGRDTDLREITETIKTVINCFGPFDLVIAHSFGSLATMLVWQENKFCNKFILVGSMANPYTAVSGFQYIFNLKQPIVDGLIKNIEKRVDKPLQNFLLSSNPNDSMKNMLLLHDKHDMVAPFSESIFLSQIYPKAKFIELEGVGHHKILSNPKTIEIVQSFVTL